MTIQRNSNGWPTTPLHLFMKDELIAEAEQWAHMRGTPYVGGAEFNKYDDELKRRGHHHDWSYIPHTGEY